MADATTTPTVDPVWGYELEEWINVGTIATPEWVKVTELTKWEVAGDATTYEPEWIDRKVKPKFTVGRFCSVEFEKDTVNGGAFEAWYIKNRNKFDVACQVCRVYTWLGTATAMTADFANFLFTPNAASFGKVGEPVISGGTLNMSDNGWTEGTWDPTAKKFTATVNG